MPTNTPTAPLVTITINGRPAAQYVAEQKLGCTITQAPGEALCTRIVALDRTVEWRGKTYVGGETIYLPPAEANHHGRRRDVVRPEDFDPAPARPVTIRQDGQRVGPIVQGPQYDRR